MNREMMSIFFERCTLGRNMDLSCEGNTDFLRGDVEKLTGMSKRTEGRAASKPLLLMLLLLFIPKPYSSGWGGGGGGHKHSFNY